MKRCTVIFLWFTLVLLAIGSQARVLAFNEHRTTPSSTVGNGWVPYGTVYVWPSDFSDVAGLRARLAYVHSLGVHTVIQMHNPNAPLATRRLFLDEAHALNMRVIVRLSGTDDPPWGWDGVNFDWSPLTAFLDGEGIADHPALLAIYGIHIPWDDFNNGNGQVDQIRRFYTEYHAIAPDIPLFHDLVWIEPEVAVFTDGMCDLCTISSMPHTWVDGDPVNNSYHITDKMVRYTSIIRQADPDAQIWIEAQTFEQLPSFRMPTAADMLWHIDMLMAHVDFDGLLWYPYLHTYTRQLGDPGMDAQRQAVLTAYMTYYWTPTTFTYLPFILR